MRAFITGKEFKLAKKPIVYMWKRGDDWLYVGLSTVGIARIFGSHHRLILSEMQDEDTINWSYYNTIEEAKTMERYLIAKHEPKFNVTYTRRMMEKMRKLHDDNKLVTQLSNF